MGSSQVKPDQVSRGWQSRDLCQLGLHWPIPGGCWTQRCGGSKVLQGDKGVVRTPEEWASLRRGGMGSEGAESHLTRS